ncbi:protein translocase subunit SecF [Synechococcus sp. PCC 7336]|uniref:protein translocase subunit SecF n=1 Tax=Synechococcus sp. PCC 7336 TaxID=195250 RepID=UPI000349A5F8|nr:protein translocase subunit SecF [Synechococcus sp. PCC 7336]
MIDVVGRSKTWFSLSALVILAGFAAMAVSWTQLGTPLRLGLDFTGGTLLQLEFEQPVSTQAIREVLARDDLGSSIIQLDRDTSRTAVIRTPPLEEAVRLAVEAQMSAEVGPFRRDRVETIGPTIGKTLLRTGLLAIVVAFAAIVVYVSFRFQFDYAVFAIAALMHDVLIVAGIFAMLGLTLGVEVDQLFVVSILTIIGFSVNDTVVIYDRIRENSRRLLSRKTRFPDVVNISVNQTFARSINTSLTSMLALLAIFLFGGPTLRYFSLALLIGFAWGTYSSIFVASTLLAWWRERNPGSGTPKVREELPESGIV